MPVPRQGTPLPIAKAGGAASSVDGSRSAAAQARPLPAVGRKAILVLRSVVCWPQSRRPVEKWSRRGVARPLPDLYRRGASWHVPEPGDVHIGPDHLEVAADRGALAAILDARGRHREAQQTLQDVLSVVETVLGPDHYEVAATLDRLAASVQHTGDYAQAVSLS